MPNPHRNCRFFYSEELPFSSENDFSSKHCATIIKGDNKVSERLRFTDWVSDFDRPNNKIAATPKDFPMFIFLSLLVVVCWGWFPFVVKIGTEIIEFDENI